MDFIIIMIINVISAIIVITTTGFARAYASYKLGDIAIKNKGYVTLNPKKHFEILGFIFFVFYGYGWGTPLDVSPLYYKDRKNDIIKTYLAGFLVCIVSIILLSILNKFLKYGVVFTTSSMLGYISSFITVLTKFFANFMVFNLIPIYPLYGYKILHTLLPTNKAIVFSQYEKLAQILVIFLLISGLLNRGLDFLVNIILMIVNIPLNLIF